MTPSIIVHHPISRRRIVHIEIYKDHEPAGASSARIQLLEGVSHHILKVVISSPFQAGWPSIQYLSINAVASTDRVQSVRSTVHRSAFHSVGLYLLSTPSPLNITCTNSIALCAKSLVLYMPIPSPVQFHNALSACLLLSLIRLSSFYLTGRLALQCDSLVRTDFVGMLSSYEAWYS